MLPSADNYNCYEYLKVCTQIYDDVYMMQHFGAKYLRSEIFHDIDALSSYFQNDLKLKPFIEKKEKYLCLHRLYANNSSKHNQYLCA